MTPEKTKFWKMFGNEAKKIAAELDKKRKRPITYSEAMDIIGYYIFPLALIRTFRKRYLQ